MTTLDIDYLVTGDKGDVLDDAKLRVTSWSRKINSRPELLAILERAR